MTLIELKSQIIKNELSNFYIFTGEEIGIINIYLEQMSNKLELPITRADSVASVYPLCTAKSMFGSTRSLYVIRDDKDFTKQEKYWDTFKKDIGKNVIVLLYDKIDSRLKFGKFFKDDTVVFEKLTPTVLKSYIKKSISLSDANTEKLAELCNYSYDLCMLEIDKIHHFRFMEQYNWNDTYDYDMAFEHLLECGVIYQPEESDVFKFTDAVCNRNSRLALHIEELLRSNGNSSINLLGTLYNSFKSIMLIQACGNSGNICETTGLDNRQVYFNKKYCGKYSLGELVTAVKLIARVIEGIKSGYIEDCYATRYVLAKTM